MGTACDWMTLLALLGPLLLTTGACSKAVDKASERAAERTVEGATGDKVTIGPNGSVTITDPTSGVVVRGGDGMTLPADWPSNVPIYPGAKIASAMSSPGAKSASFQVSDTPAQVSAFYTKSLASMKAGPAMNLDELTIQQFEDGKKTVAITTTGSKPTTVQIVISN